MKRFLAALILLAGTAAAQPVVNGWGGYSLWGLSIPQPTVNGTVLTVGGAATSLAWGSQVVNWSLTGNLTLPATTATAGIVYQGASPFLHTYADPTSDGVNTFLGYQAGNLTMGPNGGASNLGSYNTGIGNGALWSNTTGHHNNAIGENALYYNTTGYDNMAMGAITLKANTIGNYNVAVGSDALKSNVDGSNNTAVGMQSLYTQATGVGSNTGVGYFALHSVTNGNNTAVGVLSLGALGNGTYNVAIGQDSGHSNTAGSRNVFIGPESGYYETGSYKVMIDARDRGSEAGGRTGALLYGVVDPVYSPATSNGNQNLTMNGWFTASQHFQTPTDVVADLQGYGASAAITTTSPALLTLSTVALTTASAAGTLPANSEVLFLTYRITTTFTGCTSFNIRPTSAANPYVTIGTATSAQTTLTAGTTGVLVPPSGLRNYTSTANTVTITCNSNATAGAIRLTPFYTTVAGPTS